MSKKIATLIACAAVLGLAACGDFNDVIAGTNPPIAASICKGDSGCESDMRELSHKLLPEDDTDGNGIIDQEELDAARERMDKEAEEAEAAASSSAAAASSSSAAAEASRSEEARKSRESEASREAEAERQASADRAAAEREAANQQQANQEPAPAQQAPVQQQAPAQQAPAMEWATMGPYGSLFTCEQARDSWPAQSSACYTGGDGNAYFDGMRQAAR